MNLALVVPGGVDRSGEQRVIPALLALIERLVQHHRVTVFALNQEPRRARWTLRGASIENIGRPLTVLRAIAAIHARHTRAPFDAIQSLWAGDSGLVGVVAARRAGIPAFVHLAGGELVALRTIGYGGRQHALRRHADEWLLKAARNVSAASAPMIAAAATLGVGAVRIPLGVDLRTWPARAPQRRDPAAPPRLVHVASLNRVKGQTTLLEAVALLTRSHPDVRLDIVGEDTLGGELQRRASALGIDGHLKFHGFLTQRGLRPIIDTAHVHVMASWHEAGPLAALEAAVAGVPTVGTHVGHLAEWSPHAALTSAPGDAAMLATHTARLLDNEDLRLSIAHAAARIAMREDADFTAQAFLAQYADTRI